MTNEDQREPFWMLSDGMHVAKTLLELTQHVDELWRATDGSALQLGILDARHLANRLVRELGTMARHNADLPAWERDRPDWKPRA